MDMPRSASGGGGTNARPTFSVIIPSYNRSASLLRAIQSVLEQDFADFELLVVDDGSTDDSLAQLATVKDPRLVVVEQANRGASAARNTGLEHASGVYVAFLDSDDVFLPAHLTLLHDLLIRERNIAAYSQVVADRGGGRRLLKPSRGIRAGENMATYLMCDRGFVQTSGLALPRATAALIRYREDARFGDDTDFAIRLQLAGCQFVMSTQPSVVWADEARGDRLSNAYDADKDFRWLEDLRTKIPARAYFGYRGWHLAKGIWPHSKLRALGLYLAALFRRAYGPRLALVVLLQVCMPNWVYRKAADQWIGFQALLRRSGFGQTRIPVGSGIDGPISS